MTVNIRSAPGDEGARIKHWTSQVSVEEGERLTKTYAELLGKILDCADQTVTQMDAPQENGMVSSVHDTKIPDGEAAFASEKAKRSPVFVEPEASSTEDSTSTLEEEQAPAHALEPHAYRRLIKETVRETIQQLVQSGELIRPSHMSDVTDFDAGENLESANGIGQYDFGARKSFEMTGGRSAAGSYAETFSYEAMSKTLRELWSALLDIPTGKIYDDDSFFALGGDSILAMELAKSTREAGIGLTVADIFEEPGFSDMVYCMGRADMKKRSILAGSDTSSETEHEDVDEENQIKHFSLLQASNVETFLQDYICPKVGIFRGGIVDAFPVTDFQALAVTGTLIGSRWMLNYFTFDGEGNLDVGRLRKAASKLVDSFEILRTVFVPCSNHFLQVVLRTLQPQVQVFDTDQDFDDFTKQLRDTGNVSPRLGEPYTQFTVIRRTGTSAHRIILRLSHAQYDGVCLPKILDSFRAAYEGKDLVRAPPFSTYVKEACGTSADGSRSYWKKLLQGSSMTDVVPRQHPRYESPNAVPTVLVQNIRLPSLTSRNITEATLLKAAWCLTLAQLSGRSDIIFGNLISGRNVAVDGVESMVGPCVNIVPVRMKLEPRWTALELLRKIQAQQVAGMPYESLGFREIVQNCTAWPEWTYFSTIVQHQNLAHDFELALDRISYRVGSQGAQDTLADLTLVSTPKGDDKIEVTLGFINSSTLTTQFVQNALSSTCTLAQNLVRNPTHSITDIVSQSNISTSLQRHPVPISTSTATTKPSLDTLLRGASKKQVTDLADTLARNWRLVLPAAKQRHFTLTLDSSFYESGGDLISFASLSAILSEQGWDIPLEDLISRPTMGEQVGMLWKLDTNKKVGGSGGSGSSSDSLNNSTRSTEATSTGSGTGTGIGEGGENSVAVDVVHEEKKKEGWWRKGFKAMKGRGGHGKGKKDMGRTVAKTTATVAT